MADGRRWFTRRARRPHHRYAAQQIAVPAMPETIKQLVTRLEGWQEKVLKFAGIVPEVMTGYLFVHNVMDQVVLELQRFDRAEQDWLPVETPDLQGVARRVNHAFTLGRTAALMHLVEEAYILVRRAADLSFEFEVLAPNEIKRTSKTKAEKRVIEEGEKLDWVPIEGNTTIIRVYTPDPTNRELAGGPHKPLLGLLETMAVELVRDTADAISVLAGNGILLIPTEILPDIGDGVDDVDTPGTRAHFENRLEDAMLSTVGDRTKGEAIVPVVVYGPADALKEVRHVLPQRSEKPAEAQQRMDGYIQRYANDIDLPAEVITGIGGANHWTGWKVDENTWAYHLEPRAKRVADAVYAGLVREIVENLGYDPTEYRLAPNAQKAIAKSDLSGVAGEAYRVGAIKPEAYVEAIGLDPADLRDDAEELLLELGGVDPSIAVQHNQPPDRQAAARAPKSDRAILRQAARIANQHQARLGDAYTRVLGRVMSAAATSGQRARADRTSAAKPEGMTFAGYEPATYFAQYRDELEAATRDELFAFVRRIATLCGLDYRHVREQWASEFAHRAQAVTREAERAAEGLTQRSFRTGKAARVPENIVRAMTSTAHGGAAPTQAAGNTQRPTHAGQDPALQDALTHTVGAYATRYQWVVGHPQKPYPPHQRLAGLSWFSWQEFDKLDVTDAKDMWLPGSVYYPGDHNGCQCSYDIDFVPIEEAPS